MHRPALDHACQLHSDAYRKIFERCGLAPLAVEASSGAMGGSESIEFMVASDAGEGWGASGGAGGDAANLEKATSQLAEIADENGPAAPEKFATPGVRTIEDLVTFAGGAPADRQIKTLVHVLDGTTALVLLRGDHALSEQKLCDATGTLQARPATNDEIRVALGATAGSLGAVGVTGVRLVAARALQGRRDMTTGANEDGFHLRGVDVARDIRVGDWLDLREVRAGESCPACGNALAVVKAIEAGHIFKLGTRYSEAMGALVTDETGAERPIVMGSYGIRGGGRRPPRCATQHDAHRNPAANGIVWALPLALFEVVISLLNPKDVEPQEAGERLYDALRQQGIDVLLDLRDERPGVKFKDADLVGIPHRLVVGPRGLAEKKVEWKRRRDGLVK